MILLDAALPRSGGTEDRSPTHYGPELAKEAERRPAGGSLRRGPGASSPLAFWLDQSLISFYELPHGRPYAHPAPRAASVRPDQVPTRGGPGRAFIGQPSLEVHRRRRARVAGRSMRGVVGRRGLSGEGTAKP
jgi:hypothetical protein